MEFEEIVKYIYDIPKFAGKNTLKETASILKNVYDGNSKIIHVAGTNGKGSVCAYLSSILNEAGYTVGLFVSPHLVDIRERISIDGKYISKVDFQEEFEVIKEAYKVSGASHPSFFEFLFLMGMSYFGRHNPDYIILETGLGGRLDATNSVAEKELCIITEIGFDHMQYLGNSIESIAKEKAGIIRSEVPVIFSNKRRAATEVIMEVAANKNAKILRLDMADITQVKAGKDQLTYNFKKMTYQINTTALYQCENACLAILAAEKLGISRESIEKGLLNAYWPGRMEKVGEGIYIDGAHNEDGIEAFLNTVRSKACQGKRYLLFGMVNDKAYEKVIRMVAESKLFDGVVTTCLQTDRSIDLSEYMRIWNNFNMQVDCFEEVEKAWEYLYKLKQSTDEIYAAGSLYMIGELKEIIEKNVNATKI